MKALIGSSGVPDDDNPFVTSEDPRLEPASTLHSDLTDTDTAGHPWDIITGKPATFPPIIGAGAGQAVAGNDGRLTDARTPTAHHVSHETGGSDVVVVTKAQVGLGSADNTSDAAKPISTATQAALDAKSATTHTTPAMTATLAGHVPVPPNDATKVLLGTGVWGTAPASDANPIQQTYAPAASVAVLTGKFLVYVDNVLMGSAEEMDLQGDATCMVL